MPKLTYIDGDEIAAVQVTDRFHLWQNFAKAVERCVARHKSCLQEPVLAPASEQAAAAEEPESPVERRSSVAVNTTSRCTTYSIKVPESGRSLDTWAGDGAPSR